MSSLWIEKKRTNPRKSPPQDERRRFRYYAYGFRGKYTGGAGWNRPRCRAARGTKAIVEANFKLSKPRFERRGGMGRRDTRRAGKALFCGPLADSPAETTAGVARRLVAHLRFETSGLSLSLSLCFSSWLHPCSFLRKPCGIKIERVRGYRDRLGSERYTGCPSLSMRFF